MSLSPTRQIDLTVLVSIAFRRKVKNRLIQPRPQNYHQVESPNNYDSIVG